MAHGSCSCGCPSHSGGNRFARDVGLPRGANILSTTVAGQLPDPSIEFNFVDAAHTRCITFLESGITREPSSPAPSLHFLSLAFYQLSQMGTVAENPVHTAKPLLPRRLRQNSTWDKDSLIHVLRMPRILFAVVGTAGMNLVAVDAPSASIIREVSELLKAASPLVFRDVWASRIRMFKTGSRGNYISSMSFELSVLPVFMEAGEYEYASDILSDWEELHSDENVGNALPPATGTGGDEVQVVALIPIRRVKCAFGHTVLRIGINESAAVAELKDEICNQVDGMFKLAMAQTRNLRLTRSGVRGRHTPQVTNLLRALAASDEVDTSRTVRAVLGDAADRESIDLLIVPYEIATGP